MNVGIIGRFQPFHWGHLEYLLAAADLSETIVIGITNPDNESLYNHKSDMNRSAISANPFTFDERRRMIESTALRLHSNLQLAFRKCDFRRKELLAASLGPIDLVAVTVYDEWGRHRRQLLQEAGYKVHTLWERKNKVTNGTEVRDRIRDHAEWKHLVPPGCADVIDAVLTERCEI